MTAAYGLQTLLSAAAFTALGFTVRILIDPRRSLVSAARQVVTWLDSRLAVRIVQLMATVALLLSVFIGIRQYSMTACQARYNERSNVSQQARAEAAQTDREALDKLLQIVADRPEDAIAAVRQYNVSRSGADAQRAGNPVPPPPSETCG